MKTYNIPCPCCSKPMERTAPFPCVDEETGDVYYLAGFAHCGWHAPCGRGKTPEEALKSAVAHSIRRYDR